MATLFICCTSPKNPTYKDIDVAEFKTRMLESNAVILDVRTPSETAQGIIEGASIIDFRANDFSEQIDKLDKNKNYLVYCRSGGRSAKAAEIMNKKGFKSVCNLEGGYMAWSKE